MVLKTGTVKEPEKRLVTGFLVRPGSSDSQTGDVIHNLINKLLNYINK